MARASMLAPARASGPVRSVPKCLGSGLYERRFRTRLPEPPLGVLRGLREVGGERSSKKDERWVFTSHRGKLNAHYLSQTFLTFRRLAGLPEAISFHSARPTYATWMTERGVPVEVKELMGHASVTTTERYMQVRPATSRHWVDRVF